MFDWQTAEQSAPRFGVVVSTEVVVPMRDGVELRADVHLPGEGVGRPAEGPFPVILIRTPYDKRTLESRCTGEFFATRGYATVIQDVRGRYTSGGTFGFLSQEAEDGYDSVEWAGTQPWSNGRVGMMGTSYLGWAQTAAAVLNPPHLAALVVNQAAADAYTSSLRHNGALELRWMSWAFLDAATNPTAIADPALAERMRRVRASDWFDRLVDGPGATPLAENPAAEAWALEVYRRGDRDDYWDRPGLAFARHWADHADVPVLVLGAWYDSYTRASIEHYHGLRRHLTSPVRLILGPWTHGAAPVDQSFSGDVEFGATAPVAGNLAADFNHLNLQWFDRWLVGIPNGVEARGPVTYFLMEPGPGGRSPEGRLIRGGRWLHDTAMPPTAAVPTAFHLRAGGGLTETAPDEAEASTTWTYDPADPVPTVGGNISSLSDIHAVPASLEARIPTELRWGSIVATGGHDQVTTPATTPPTHPNEPHRPLRDRHDVVVFETEPLLEPVTVVGPITAVVHVSSDAPDTDVTVKLIDVHPPTESHPHGYALNLSDSIFRLRYRHDWYAPSPLEPGEVYEVEIPMYGTANVFGVGHRIRVDISSSNHPRFDVNPNTGESNGAHTHLRVAHNTIHHDADRPSRLVLPVVKPAGSDD